MSAVPLPAAPPPPRKWLTPLFSAGLLALVLWLLHRTLAGYHLHEVFAHLRALPLRAELIAAAAALASYLLLCGYDFLALRYIKQKVHWARTVLTSFTAFAIGHNVGFVSLSGAAVRVRLYGSVGIPTADVAVMSAFCILTTALGSIVLVALALLFEPIESAMLLRLPPWSVTVLGVVLIATFVGYLFWVEQRRAPLVLRGWSLQLPNVGMSLAQTAIAALDLCIAALCMYVLLPQSVQISYSALLAIYVLSQIAVLVSNVPGGLGVLESVIVLALPRAPADELLASLIAYRIIYYVLPFVLAAVVLLGHEAWLQRHRVRVVAGFARDWVSAAAPLAMGMLVLLAGAVLLVSGAIPGAAPRLRGLEQVLPLPVLEISHLLGSVAGLGLIILSRALMRRVGLAWQIALLLLFGGAALSLLKGLDYEEATVLLIIAGILYSSRAAFYRRAALLESKFNLRWLLGVAMIVGVVVWIGFLANRHVQYSNELWWTFAFESDAPRMLRATLVVSLLTAAFIAHAWLSPHAPVGVRDELANLPQIPSIVANNSRATAALALLGDKRVLLHPDNDAFIMYQASGRSWIAMGDPVLSVNTPGARASELAWSFRELSDEYDGWTVFYQVTPELLTLYVDLGLALLKLGEEARVPLPQFTLEGRQRAEFRTVRRKAEREGASFEIVTPPIATELLQQLAPVSQDWLTTKSAHEKRFSVGYFQPEYLQNFPIALVRRHGEIVAFANLWPTANRHEISVDLMRYGAHAPSGIMDYLFVEAILWAKGQGYQWFNLGMAPLSGLEQHYLAPAWHRIDNFVFDVGGHFYNFEGLRRYKEKFQPVWEPRYLAAPGGLALPWVLLDVATVIAGGRKEILFK